MNQESEKEKLVKGMIRIVILAIIFILIFLGIMATILTAYFGNTYESYTEKILYKTDHILIQIVGIIIGIVLIYGIYQLFLRCKNKYILIALSLLYVAASVCWILMSKSPLRADARVVEACAREFVEGNFLYLHFGQYLYNHPLQLGIVLAMEFVYRITGMDNAIIFKFLNVGFSLIAILYLCKITKLLFQNENIQKLFYILTAGCIILVLFNVLVYGNIVGLMFGMIALYYTLKYLENKKWQYLLWIVLSMTLATILKSNFQVYMIGIVIVLILDLFKEFKIQTIVAMLIMFLCVFSSSSLIIEWMEKRTGLEIGSGIPMVSYIHMGMARPSDRASGWYNAEVNVEKTFEEAGYQPEVASKMSKEGIKERLKDMMNTPIDTIKFYGDKILSTWLEPAFQTLWTAEPQERFEEVPEIAGNKILISIYDGKLNTILLKYLDIFAILIYVSAAYYCISNFKKIGKKEFLLLVIFLGGFLFHILWETKSIYAIPYFVLLLPYAAAGIYERFVKIQQKMMKKEDRLLSDGRN